MTSFRSLSDRLAVGGQPTVNDLQRLRAQGFATVVNLRQPDEGGEPLDPAAEGAAAAERGLGYHHLPVALDRLKPAVVEQLRQAIQASPGPVYVHCGAGERACSLALLATGDRLATVGEDLIAQAADLGFSVTDERLATFIKEVAERERVTLQQAI